MARASEDTETEATIEIGQIMDAIFIEDCHISGMHDPTHTRKYVCEKQLADLARRVLAITCGVDFAVVESPKFTRAQRIHELNKIPRRIDKGGWYAYYLGNPSIETTKRAREMELWEKEGLQREVPE